MSGKTTSEDEQEDAAFRARLAPLASEVLPPATASGALRTATASKVLHPALLSEVSPSATAAGATTGARPARRQHVIAWGAAIAAVAVLGAASLLSRWPWSGDTTPVRGFAGPSSPPRIELLSAPLSSKPATSDGASAVLPAAPTSSDPMMSLLLRRGDAALADGDIIAARLMYERAADLGSASAATSAGKTYDVDFLLQTGARGIQPDQTAAAAWFRKAVALGDPEAGARLARIEGRPRP
jgi:hypothetical protein